MIYSVAEFTQGQTITVASGVYQYDYGQILMIKGLSLQTIEKVDFSTQESGGQTSSSYGLTRNNITEVLIPAHLLWIPEGLNYNIWAFVYVTEIGSGQTLYKIRIPVTARPEPTDIALDAGTQTIIDQLVAAINEAVDNAEHSEQEAAASEENAEAWAVGERGGEPVTSGDETFHNNAKYYAGYAYDAKTAAEGFKEGAEIAQGRAEDAVLEAQRAQGRAEDAQGFAEAAQTAAETAKGKAEQARDTAEGKADDALAAAKNARSWAVGGTGTRTGENTDNAQYYKEQAANSAGTSYTWAESAANSATKAESYAVGGTGTRSGEDADNAKYYAGLAEMAAEAAGYAWFDVSDITGEMIVTVADSLSEEVSFEVDENTGSLEVIIE